MYTRLRALSRYAPAGSGLSRPRRSMRRECGAPRCHGRSGDPSTVPWGKKTTLSPAAIACAAAATAHPVRKQQIQAAIAEIDKRLAGGAK